MAADNSEYLKMYGDIVEDTVVMAKCNCIACNGNCRCICRGNSDLEVLNWD